jgi:hypothetical protein
VGESLDLVALAAEGVHAIPETVLLVRTELLLEARARLDAGWLVEEQHLSPGEADSSTPDAQRNRAV